jgi:hypothetical protein
MIGRLDLSLYIAKIAAVEGRAGRDHTILVQISFSDGLIRIAVVKNKSAIGQLAISPEGTTENHSCPN